MATFKNLHRLIDVDQKDLDKIEHAAKEHERHNSISFKLEHHDAKTVIIRVDQGRNAAGAYHKQKRLIEIVHETFDRFFPDKKVKVHAHPYVESPVSKVDAEWINKKMLETGTKLKDIDFDTGLNYTYLSSIVNGNETLSQLMKAFFYYYFLAKEKRKK